MKFRELSIDEYETFAITHPYRYYLNSSKIIELRKKNGWNTYYVGVVDDNNQVMAAAGFYSVPIARKYHYAYAIRGILCNFEDKDLTSFFTEHLKAYIASHGMAFLRMDPYLEYQQLDVNGQIVENGFNNQHIIDFLESLGYQHQGFWTGQKDDCQTRYMVVLDLENKTEKDIQKGYDPKTRRTINKAIRNGVQSRKLSKDDLSEFMKLMDFTAEKRHFVDMGEETYRNQMESFGDDNAQVVISYLDTQYVLEQNQKEREQNQKDLDAANAFLAEHPTSKNNKTRKKLAEERLASLDKLDAETKLLEEKHGSMIILSAAYFVIYDDEMYYISSGSYDEFRKYNGPFYLQNEAIHTALKRGCRRYNFTGTSGVFDESANDFGVFEFKRRLGGRPIELIGEFKLVCDPKMMKKIQRVESLKRLIKG